MKVSAQKLEGKVNLPSSKSLSHRSVIAASLSKGKSYVNNLNLCDDVIRTIEGLRNLGAKIVLSGNNAIIEGIDEFKDCTINCHESGSTMRFLFPLALMANEVFLTGAESLLKRPMDIYLDLFKQVKFDQGYLIRGVFQESHYQIKGDVSSQFISGLLFSLPLQSFDSIIEVLEPFESKSYVDLTIDVLTKFGIEITQEGNYYIIKGNQQYRPTTYQVEADYSAYGFFAVANAIGNNVEVLNLSDESLQGDRVISTIIETSPEVVDVRDCPDLVPILAVYYSLTKDAKIVNAKRLRIKESDRLKAISEELNKIGAQITELEEGLEIKKVNNFIGNKKVSSHNDHRIAMALAIAASRCQGYLEIDSIDVVNKSYSSFIADYIRLGGSISE